MQIIIFLLDNPIGEINEFKGVKENGFTIQWGYLKIYKKVNLWGIMVYMIVIFSKNLEK